MQVRSIWYIADSANSKRARYMVVQDYGEQPLSGRELNGYRLRSNESVWLMATTED